MKITKLNQLPNFVLGYSDYDDCPKCKKGSLCIPDGYDIFNDNFYFNWECDTCEYYSSIEGKIVKYQKKLDDDNWVDVDEDEEDAGMYISCDSCHYIDIANIDGTDCLVYIGKDIETDTEYRAIIKDAIFEDNI